MLGQEKIDAFRGLLDKRKMLREVEETEHSLTAFFRAAWHVIEPDTPLIWSWNYDYLAEWLELISAGEFKTRYPEKRGIIFNVPPRTAKSSFITVSWPIWTWLNRAGARFLCGSYSDRLATDHSIKRRNLIQSKWFQERFGERFSLKNDRNNVGFFENDKTGYCMATSVGASGTGFGGDFLIGDDLLNAEAAFSEAERTSTNRWIDATWSTRLNDPGRGVFVYVSQRLAQDDPTGHLLEEQKDQWIHVKIPLEAQEKEKHIFPVSGDVFEREPGDVLQSARFTPEVVKGLKANSREWAGQYSQEPAPMEGGIVKKHWWKFYVMSGDQRPDGCLVLPEKFDEIVMSADLTFKDKKTSDFVCCGVVARAGSMKYVMTDLVWDRLDFPATKKAIRGISERWPMAHAKYVEDKANGPAIIADLRQEISGLIAVEPMGSKEARLHAASPDIEAGNVVLPHPSICSWTRRAIEECAAACCGGKNDDFADMLSQAINLLRKRTFRHGLIDSWKEQATTPITIQGKAEVCGICGNENLSMFGEILHCNACGWKSTQDVNAGPPRKKSYSEMSPAELAIRRREEERDINREMFGRIM